MKKLLRVLVIAALLVAIAIPCLATADECPAGGEHHMVLNTQSSEPATCTKDGKTVYSCDKCYKHDVETVVPATGHKFGEWQDTTPATCTKDGKQTRTCKNCPVTETRTIAAIAHKPVDSKKTGAPTCINPGWKAIKECSVCHTVLEKEDDPNQPATGICTSFKTVKVDSTCAKEGYEVEVCKICGKEHGQRTVIETKQHTWGPVTEKTAATCTEDQTTVRYCKVCGAEEKATKVAGTKLGHDWSAWTVVTEATCTEKGSKTRTCARCGKVETVETKALNHKAGKPETLTAATCTEDSVGCIKCTRCGEIMSKWTNEGSALKHVEKTVIVEPTCTTEGSVTTICTRCNETLKTEVVKKLPHTYEWKVTKEPANKCDTTEETKICKVCGAKGETRVIKGAAHEWSTDPIVAKQPTCTEKGVKAIACKVCGTVKEGAKTEEIPALGHKPGEYTQTKAPTCTEKGEEVSKCTVCNAVVDTREVAAKGHTAGEWITVRQPSASQNGKMIQKCTVCGAQIGKKYIRANGSADTVAKTVAYVAGTEVANYAKIDLTVDATTELDLVSANGTKVGKLVVEVKEGKVTVKYELSAVPADAFLTFVAEAPSKDVHAEKEFEFEKAISVADELAGAAAAYIYVEIEY